MRCRFVEVAAYVHFMPVGHCPTVRGVLDDVDEVALGAVDGFQVASLKSMPRES